MKNLINNCTIKDLVIMVIFSTLPFLARSQFNDSTNYHTRYDITGIINRTNDNRSFVLNNAFLFSIQKKAVTLTSNNSWIYGRQNGNLSNNDFNTVLNLDLYKDMRKLYYWGLASFTSSYSLKINQQTQTGAGIGYNFLNSPAFELVATDGLLYEFSSLKITADSNDYYQTIRNSLRIKHRLVINNIISLQGTHFWQPSLKDFSDYIIRSSATLSVKLRAWLTISGGVTYNKISRTQRENLLFSVGLGFENYF